MSTKIKGTFITEDPFDKVILLLRQIVKEEIIEERRKLHDDILDALEEMNQLDNKFRESSVGQVVRIFKNKS